MIPIRVVSFLAFLLSLASPALAEHGSPAPSGPDADTALKMLLDGNARFVRNRTAHPHQDARTRQSLVGGQHPFAIILSCADSRVPPEILFDEGVGDLFVVRVAGNVADGPALASLEYGALVLKAHLIMVLGHESCGAVSAALKHEPEPGHIGELVHAIEPAVEHAAATHPTDLLDAAVRENVKNVVKGIEAHSPELAALVARHELKIVGARYDLHTGAVTLLPTSAEGAGQR